MEMNKKENSRGYPRARDSRGARRIVSVVRNKRHAGGGHVTRKQQNKGERLAVRGER